jgi:mono/diheme cytochrome c family protein
MRTLTVTMLAGLALVIASSCQGKKVTPVERGRVIYMSNCVVCHNRDPNLPGSQGPPIAGSSFELVQDRVLHLAYPPGYTPKRKTHAMRAIPTLAPEIGNIVAFLQAAKRPEPGAAASQ